MIPVFTVRLRFNTFHYQPLGHIQNLLALLELNELRRRLIIFSRIETNKASPYP